MWKKRSFVLFCALGGLTLVSAAGCGGGDSCVAAKQHMCERIPDMGCSAGFMDSAQEKIANACGQAELAAYVPALQNACSASQAAGVPMDCPAIAGKTYATPGDASVVCTSTAPPQKFTYAGTATADGRAATLEFTVSGSAVVAGKLHADPVCATSIHLNRTDVDFTGTLSGTWESATGSIIASWTGGDFACDGTALTAAMGYPTSGTLTITMVGNIVQLQRIISNAEPYQFPASGQVYVAEVPTTCADAAVAGPDAPGTGGIGAGGIDGGAGGRGGTTGAGGASGRGGTTSAGGAGGATAIPIDGGRDAPAVGGADAAADAKGDVAGDAGSGGPVPFALLVTQSPPGPSNGSMTTWGGVLQFTVAGAGATLQPATGIPAAMLHDPAGLAFRASSSEVFVANRHGNNSADGIAGSINRFKYDRATRSFTANGSITGNGLSGVHSLTFSPITGELFAANITGGVSRFTFDAQGAAVAHGVIADGTTRGVLVSNDGTRLWVTSASTSIRAFDLSSGSELTSVALPSGANLHYFGTLNGTIYVGGLNDDLVHRLTVGAGNALVYKDAIPGHAPISIAFSPDGLEMFVGGHRDTDVIDRYKPAVTATGATDGWAETTTFSTGSSLGAILVIP